MPEETNYYNNVALARRVALEMKKESEKCSSIEDYLMLAYSLRFDNVTIEPIQIKEELHELLEVLLKRKPKTMLEIGTGSGGTLFVFSKVATEDAIIISIDLSSGSFGGGYPDWKVSLYKSFASDKQILHLIRSDSHDSQTLQRVKDILDKKRLDFLFIDGDHNYAGVKKDFEMYSPLVKDSGIIALHDINTGPFENVGEVPKFWSEIKSKHAHIEIITPSQVGYGIGLLHKSCDESSLEYVRTLKTVLELKDKQIENVSKQLINNPMGALLSVYSRRTDLQKAFPEVSEGDYTKLLEWAVKWGLTTQLHKDMLLPYKDWYASILSKLNKMAPT